MVVYLLHTWDILDHDDKAAAFPLVRDHTRQLNDPLRTTTLALGRPARSSDWAIKLASVRLTFRRG
jgi:hypothetical protein